ncbi:hypothetical protein EDD18DRAFT_1131157 [Armillaria luteobubalina]|uniref:Zinc finger PHD-type domain-containing protein n=1 Tax=Armillaria luteobubalina TaxID=153913 RepID=A0AA39QKB5_9AGAR|nr:hypothetical protein EDD18DRAFT_1131157 [Armillaria luteobubalina]
MSACVECKRTHSVYTAYLLTCSQCKTSYHHSCHKPPLSQARLTSILSATFGDVPDVENSLLSWKCSVCTGTLGKRAAAVVEGRPAKRVAAEVISISSDSESEDVPGPSRRWSSPIEIVDSPRHDPMDVDDEPQVTRVPDVHVKPDIATTWLRDLLYKDLSEDPWERRRKDRPRKIKIAPNVDSFYFVNKY